MTMGEVIRGPWPQKPQKPEQERRVTFAWRSRHPSPTEARRDAILAAKPRCQVCDVPFARGYDKATVCRQCRRDLEKNTSPDDPALF